MDLSKIPTEDLQALRDGDLSKVSTTTLAVLSGKAPMPEKSWGRKAADGVRDVGAGAVRGLGSIGATLISPFESSEANDERRKAMDQALTMLVGSNPESMAYQGGKLVAEVGATLPVGGALAATARAAGVAPAVVSGLRTGGFSTGLAPTTLAGKAGNAALRAGTGAASGAAGAALVNPEDTLMGAGVGAALPGIISTAGRVGGVVGDVFRADRGGKDLAKALDAASPEQAQAIAQRLRDGTNRVVVPGSSPTVAQVLNMPQASIVERVVAAGPGGEELRLAYQAQNAARMNALDTVAQIDPNGAAQARSDTGAAIAQFARQQDKAAKARTSALYESVPQSDPAIFLPDLAGVRDKFYGAGSFADRGAADRAVAAAQQIGTETLPAIKAAISGRGETTLAQAVRKAGGLSLASNSGLAGELRGLRGDIKRLVAARSGKSPAEMAEKMFEAGYLPDDDASTLIDFLRKDATTGPVYSRNADMGREFAAARDRALGDAPGAETIQKKVTLGEFDRLRQDIGAEGRKAAKAGDDRSAAALGQMKAALDDKLNAVVAGDVADESLPMAWADALSQARQSKVDQVARFRTGPQAEIFKQTAPGVYAKDGGEVASLFWGNRPGLKEDVQGLKRLIGDNTDLLGKFRSLITTEGAAKAAQGGVLGDAYVRWVQQSLPGLSEAFSPAQTRMLQRIAEDISRSSGAAKLGMGPGSNTYQNAANALDLGLLDSRAMGVVANRLPLVGQSLLEGVKTKAKETKGKRLASLLSDAEKAAEELERLRFATDPGLGLLSIPLARTLPAASSDR